jgi:hypothetical protein
MKEMGKRYCKGCEKECVLSGKEMPDNGCIEDRMKVGIMEFKDPKGRSPKEYYKVLKKMNISMEDAIIEAGKKNYIIDEIHMNMVEKERVVKDKENKKKGRPKKEKKEVEVEKVKDLFAELVEDTVNSELGVSKVELEEVKVSTPRLKEKKVKKVDFVEKEVDKKEKKAKKEKKVKILEVDVESEAKKKAEEEEAKKLEAKKKAEEEEAKMLEAKKKAEEEANKKEEEPVKVTVTRFEFEGKKYLKSSVNILYDADTKEEMGIWCEESKSIKALPDDDEDEEEMEEEDYE